MIDAENIEINNESQSEPFVKWLGGKRQLLDRISPRMPKEYSTYHEPFLGGGAVFFSEKPARAYLNDVNKQLICCYEIIKKEPEKLINRLADIDNEYKQLKTEEARKKFYYERRSAMNNQIKVSIREPIETAALFIFVNKHCFNGMFRVNKKGLMNSAFNKSKHGSFNPEVLRADSVVLQNANIITGDFVDALALVEKDDFVFIDSPYAPLSNTTFVSYSDSGFSVEQHIKLANEFKRLDRLGAKLMLTNHDTDLIRELYKDYDISVVDVRRSINGDGANRTGTEVIITNEYERRG